ncbi:glycoside hydrolase superfamily [Pholiota molesta]|nr:glycoside hydrolase superfamily [Pholiota molesta]
MVFSRLALLFMPVLSALAPITSLWNQVASDAQSQGFGAIRIIGFDCNALDLASSAAASFGLQVMAGIYVETTIAAGLTGINNDVQTFRAAYSTYGAGRYIGLTIGNEVNDSPDNIMAKAKCLPKGYLGSVGVSTPVSTVHTWVTIRDNPTLCGADFVGANAHAFYDGSVTSGQAGDFVFKTVDPALKAACPGKKIYITESGWASRGSNFGNAVASVTDEANALLNLNCACRDDTSISLWKANDNERSFGIFGKIQLNGGAFAPC